MNTERRDLIAHRLANIQQASVAVSVRDCLSAIPDLLRENEELERVKAHCEVLRALIKEAQAYYLRRNLGQESDALLKSCGDALLQTPAQSLEGLIGPSLELFNVINNSTGSLNLNCFAQIRLEIRRLKAMKGGAK